MAKKLDWKPVKPDAREIGDAEAAARGNQMHVTVRPGKGHEHSRTCQVHKNGDKWWASGIMTETPMCADTPEEVMAMVQDYVDREENRKAWDEYMATVPPTKGNA